MKKIFVNLFEGMLSTSVVAKVISVDKAKDLCDVIPVNEGSEILDVQLKVDNGKKKGHILYPKIGSLVIVAPIDNSRSSYYVAMFSEVSEIYHEIDSSKLVLDKDGITISKGSDNLNKILNELVEQMLKIYAPKDVPGLIKLKLKINNLLNDA